MQELTETPSTEAEPGEHPLEVWREYERRKRVIENLGLTPHEYEKRIGELSDELGI